MSSDLWSFAHKYTQHVYSHTFVLNVKLLNAGVDLTIRSVLQPLCILPTETEEKNLWHESKGKHKSRGKHSAVRGGSCRAGKQQSVLLILPIELIGALNLNRSQLDSSCPPLFLPVLQEGRFSGFNQIKVLWASSKGLSYIYKLIIKCVCVCVGGTACVAE